MIRFDAYSATTTAAKHEDLVNLLAAVGGLGSFDKIKTGRGFHTFGHRISLDDGCGAWSSVMWGGQQGERVMLEVKGERTPAVVEALREKYEHRCTRVDACADFDAPKVFERIYRQCRAVKKAHNIMGGKAGDWEDFPEKGRTLYLGASSSPTRLRLYEKGKQPEYAHLDRPNWTRIETQVRPKGEHKELFATLSPRDVWGSSRWTRVIAETVLKEHVDPHPAGSVWRKTQEEMAFGWMCKQYEKLLESQANALGGWDALGLTIKLKIEENKRLKKLKAL